MKFVLRNSVPSTVSSRKFSFSFSASSNNNNDNVILEAALAGSHDPKEPSSRQAIPPPVPRRRFCSVAVASATPIKEVVWQTVESPKTAPSQAALRTFSDVACCVTGPDIDAELDVLPPSLCPSSQLIGKATTSINGDSATANFGVSTRSHHQNALSRDIIHRDYFSNNAAKRNVGVCTISTVTISRATASDDLTQCKDVKIGPGHVAMTKDASVATEPVTTRNSAVNCHIKNRTFHKMTMTLTSKEQTENDVDFKNYRSVSTNTDAIVTQDHFDKTQSFQLNKTASTDFPIAVATSCANQTYPTFSTLSIQQPISTTSSLINSEISDLSDSIRSIEGDKEAINMSYDIGSYDQPNQNCLNGTLEEVGIFVARRKLQHSFI